MMERLFSIMSCRVRNMVNNVTCRHVRYSIAVAIAKWLLCSRIGLRYAISYAEPLLRLLDEAGVKHHPEETAVRMTMFAILYPWAYCRFTRCPKEMESWVQVSGLDTLNMILSGGRGILLACNHCGPAHMVEYYLAARGYKVNVMQKNPLTHDRRIRYAMPEIRERIKKLFTEYDMSPGMLKTTIKIRDILRHGEIMISALDGYQGRSELRLMLLGRERPFRITLPMAAALADAVIIPVYTTMIMDGTVKIIFDNPFPERYPEQPHQDYAMDIMRLYVAGLQGHLESEPGNLRLNHLNFLTNSI